MIEDAETRVADMRKECKEIEEDAERKGKGAERLFEEARELSRKSKEEDASAKRRLVEEEQELEKKRHEARVEADRIGELCLILSAFLNSSSASAMAARAY